MSSVPPRPFPIRLCAALSLAALSACGPSVRPRPSVVVVLVDELRKDSFDREAPRLQELARQGVVFENMRSVAPWTYPSVVSLMSGLYPQQHGADGHAFENQLATFDPEVPLLPALLREHGYRTAAFMTNPFFHRWNPFHEAFDHYDIQFVNSQGNLRGYGKVAWTEHMFADSVNAAVREWYDGRPRSGPEFTYLHYIDVHGPWQHAPFEPDYDAAIRFIDRRLVEIYQYFLERYEGDLLFLVTSDHGRALPGDLRRGDGPRFRKNKASVHDFNLRIPLVLLPGKGVPGPQVVSLPCSNVDVTPTLLDWLGIPPAGPTPGISLLPWIRGAGDDQARRPLESPLYSVVSAFGNRSDCLVVGERKFLRHFDPRDRSITARQVFDLAGDPDETRSLGSEFEAAARLLEEAAGSHGLEFTARVDEMDDELRDKLQALGYLK